MILFDSGSDEHICGLGFAPMAPTKSSTNLVTMRDAQGNIIPHTHQRDVSIKMQSDCGEIPGEATFEVADVPGAILSAGKLIQKGFRAVLDASGSYIERGGKRVELATRKNSFYLPAHVCAINGGDDDEMDSGGSSGSEDPAPAVAFGGRAGVLAPPAVAFGGRAGVLAPPAVASGGRAGVDHDSRRHHRIT